jgi:PIN domain nuclease of toxin-antitoxin system
MADAQLSSTANSLIVDPGNDKLVSPASYWEIGIKISLKKYVLAQDYEVFMHEAIDKNGFGYLPIEPKHTAVLTTLAFHHKDPFDRLLVAQAIVESIPIVSIDRALDSYSIKRLW